VSALYLDSSAFVKVVIDEAESSALHAYMAASHARRVSSTILCAEALRAVRHLGPAALAIVREALRRVDLIAIDDRVLGMAGILEPGVLRMIDAIHLATALAVGDDLEAVVTYDDRMVAAARLVGVRTVAPR
jgi:predicted nucleic acid-binding protein